MKKNWSTSELKDFWRLKPEEKYLLGNKNGTQRFLYLLVLKCYAIDYSFIYKAQEISKILLNYGITQYGIEVTTVEIMEFLENNYNYLKYQKQIREFYGVTLFSNAAQIAIGNHLYKLALDIKHEEKLELELREYLKKQKVELPSQLILNTLIKDILIKVEHYIFQFITNKITTKTTEYIDNILLLRDKESQNTPLSFLKQDSGSSRRDSITLEIEKLELIKKLNISESMVPIDVSPKVFKFYKRKIISDTPEQIRSKPAQIKYPLIIIYCYLKQQEIIDNLVEHLINFVHKINKNSSKTEAALNGEIIKLSQVIDSLYQIAELAHDKPESIIKDAIYPVVSKEQINAIIKARSLIKNLKQTVQDKLIKSYNHHYRKHIFDILISLNFKSNNVNVLSAIALIKKHQHIKSEYYPIDEKIVVEGLVYTKDIPFVQVTIDNKILVNRKSYEYAILKVLRDKLKTKEVWIVGGFKYRDPKLDTPTDFDENQEYYYGILNQPISSQTFNQSLKYKLFEAVTNFDNNLPKNKYVEIITRNKKPWIKLSPSPEQPHPKNLDKLKDSILEKWPVISLLDMVKEVDLREQFTECFTSSGNREILSMEEIQQRLILCLFGIGTNTGLSHIASSIINKVSVEDLKYINRKFINHDDLREAITRVVNAIFSIRNTEIWGETTTACAADSRKFTSWDQNLMTEWHARYHGAGVMIYWHVTRQSICIHSQLKTCSSSEVASMLQGVINHVTDMSIESQYADSHGKSEIGFALTYLLGFDLLPRYATIGPQKIYIPDADFDCKNIKDIITRPINFELIATHYNAMMKYAVALKIGTATADSIIRQFSKSNYQHPTYKAFIELGKAVKSIFLCRYLDSLELRQEIHSGLNIVENWNSVNDFIFYGKKSEISTNSRDDQETSMLYLHLLQVCLAYVNILLIQDVLSNDVWQNILTSEDFRGLNPLIYQHVNPYGLLELDMNKRISIMEVA